MKDASVYEFGPFRLDAAERQLLCEGRPISLTAKLFDLLLLLVENSGRLVSKQTMMERIWPNSFVEKNNLTVSMSTLRKTLGEGQADARYIETVPGHGYRFVAKVVRLGVIDRSAQSFARLQSIAILPFEVLSGEADEQHLGLGMADILIAKLSIIKQVIVTPLSTVVRCAKTGHDPLSVGKDLGVDAVLHGNIQKEGGRIRVTVRLEGVRNEELLWTAKFDYRLKSIFAIQDSIAEQTAQALRMRLTCRERDLLAKRYTDLPEAFIAYQKGRYFWNKRFKQGIEKAIDYFQQAIEIDADYPLAYIGLADSYNLLTSYGLIPPGKSIPRIKSLIKKALKLDDSLAEAHTTLGYIHLFYDWNWAGAQRDFRYALELNPNYAIAHGWYAMYLMITDQYEEALTEMMLAQTLDPLSPIISVALGGYYFYARKYEQAIAQCRETIKIDPNFHLGYGILGGVLAQIEEYEEAAEQLKKAISLSKDPEVTAELAYIYARSNRIDEAQRLLKELIDNSKQKFIAPFGIAIAHLGLGNLDEAFRWLEGSYKDRNHWMVWLRDDPRLDPLRADPRFYDLLRRIGLSGPSKRDGNADRVKAYL